jgi:hypothetical protein
MRTVDASNNTAYSANGLLLLHEVMLSLNVGLTAAIIIFGSTQSVVAQWLYRFDQRMSAMFRIDRTDLVTNYFSYFAVALFLALCFWTLLRLTYSTWLTRRVILVPAAGLAALAALPVLAINPWSNVGVGRKVSETVEIIVVLILMTMYAFRFIRRTFLIPASIVMFHFLFWCGAFGISGIWRSLWMVPRQFHAFMLFVPAFAPMAWLVACLSAVCWTLYVKAQAADSSRSR